MPYPPLTRLNGNDPAPATGGLVAVDGTALLSKTPGKPSAPLHESPEPAPLVAEQPVGKPTVSRSRWLLAAVVLLGAVIIAAIGFAGSYNAVRELAVRKGFGGFAPYFPIGIDAGIVVLLALDLLLTWLRIGFPLLRQAAWLLTAATVAFNAAAAWPDPLGVGMHAVIPVLFIVAVEAARHAVGRIADITADTHMEGVRLARWLLAFPSTFRLWRRMKLWELRSYETAIAIEQEWAVYREQLRAHYGRGWKRRAPVTALAPLRLARYGIPLTDALARTHTPDAPATGRVPRGADASAPDASGRTPDAPKAPASGVSRPRARTASTKPRPDAGKPDTDDQRLARLRQLADDGKAPTSIRQAAELLGCRQSKAKQLLAAEGLLTTTSTET